MVRRHNEGLLLADRGRGHPVLRWCASNTVVKHDPAGSLKPDKARSTGRIDLLVALIMSLGRAQAQSKKSFEPRIPSLV